MVSIVIVAYPFGLSYTSRYQEAASIRSIGQMKTTKHSANRKRPEEPVACRPKKPVSTAQSGPFIHHFNDSAGLEMNNGVANSSNGQCHTNSVPNEDKQQPMPFVMIQEPLRPASKEHRKTVRHHVMRAVHSRRRAQNKTTVRKHTLIQKDTSASSAPKSESTASEASASGSCVSPTSSLDPDTIDEGIEELTKSSSAVAYPTDRNKQLLVTNYSACSPRQSKSQGGTLEDSQFFSIAGFIRPFDQWTFDTCESTTL